MHTAAALSDLTLSASAHVRADRIATTAQLAAGGASDIILANKATRTVATLREAYTALGAGRLDAVLGNLSQTALRLTLKRLDAGRPGVDRMRRPELLCVLGCIAAGDRTWAEAEPEPIGAVRFIDHDAQIAAARSIFADLRTGAR